MQMQLQEASFPADTRTIRSTWSTQEFWIQTSFRWGSIRRAQHVSYSCIFLDGCKVFSQPGVETVWLDLSLCVLVILGHRVAGVHVRKQCSHVSRTCSDSSTLFFPSFGLKGRRIHERAAVGKQWVSSLHPTPPHPSPSPPSFPPSPPLFLLLSPSLGSC